MPTTAYELAFDVVMQMSPRAKRFLASQLREYLRESPEPSYDFEHLVQFAKAFQEMNNHEISEVLNYIGDAERARKRI